MIPFYPYPYFVLGYDRTAPVGPNSLPELTWKGLLAAPGGAPDSAWRQNNHQLTTNKSVKLIFRLV